MSRCLLKLIKAKESVMLSAITASIARNEGLSDDEVRYLTKLDEILDLIYKLEILKRYYKEEGKDTTRISREISNLSRRFRRVELNVEDNVMNALEKIEFWKRSVVREYILLTDPGCHHEAGISLYI